MDDEVNLDTRGLKCPLPVLKARKRLKSMAKGERLILRADDPMAVVDVPHFCAEAGHRLLEHVEMPDEGDVYVIEK